MDWNIIIKIILINILIKYNFFIILFQQVCNKMLVTIKKKKIQDLAKKLKEEGKDPNLEIWTDFFEEEKNKSAIIELVDEDEYDMFC